jgi:hypothetical protein
MGGRGSVSGISTGSTVAASAGSAVLTSAPGAMTFSEILGTTEGRQMIERIEELEDDIRGRGIDMNDTSEFLVRARNLAIDELKKKYGYVW